MDFIDRLPSSWHTNSILLVMDRLTKYGHFLSLKHSYTIKKLVGVFLMRVYKLYRLPKFTVTNRIHSSLASFGSNYSCL